jgi:hypothetical protein
MKRSILFWVAAVGFSAAAHAQSPGRLPVEAQPAAGSDARAWLALQKSGVAAPSDPRPVSGEVATRVYERYLESYTRPIPEAFEREGFGSGGQSQ